MATPSVEDLERLAALERSMSERLAGADENPAAVLAAGEEVLAFAEVEERLFFPIVPLLDPLVRAELEHEHEQLADDLQLLRSLFTANPDCLDAVALAPALAKRLRVHLARDARLIAHALRLGTRVTQAFSARERAGESDGVGPSGIEEKCSSRPASCMDR